MRKEVTKMESSHFAEMSSRGRQSTEMIQANCILIKRLLTARGYSVELLEGQIAKRLGPYLADKGPPAKRTVQDWVQDTPDFPETALRDEILTTENILPELIQYLRPEGFHVDLHQDISSISQMNPSLGRRAALALVVGGIWLISEASKKRPPGQGFRLTGRG